MDRQYRGRVPAVVTLVGMFCAAGAWCEIRRAGPAEGAATAAPVESRPAATPPSIVVDAGSVAIFLVEGDGTDEVSAVLWILPEAP